MEKNKQEIAPDVAKRDEMIDTYIRRQAILTNKFPEFLEAPKSIQDEYFALNSLVDSLQTSRREIWGQTISSDGCAIDSFVAQKYEDALARFSELNRENAQYITHEEEANFEFPEIDFDGLREEVQGMRTTTDYRVLDRKLAQLQQEPLPEATKAKLYELNKEMAQISKDGKLVEEETLQRAETPAPVNESKFAHIYGKAKGRIQQVFSRIKSFFKEPTHDKSNDNQDLDNRE